MENICMDNSRDKGRICTPNCSSENSGHFFNGHPVRKLSGVRNHRCSSVTELHNSFLPICSETCEFIFSNQEVFLQFISCKDGSHVFIRICSKFQTLRCKFYRTRRKAPHVLACMGTSGRQRSFTGLLFHTAWVQKMNFFFFIQRSG